MKETTKMAATLKAAALIGLVENGIIQRDENGDIATEAFENFWKTYELQLDAAVEDLVSDLLKQLK